MGNRRVVVNADGVAEQTEGNTSQYNDAHITVVIALLWELYGHRSGQDRVMTLICPHKEQVKRVIKRFSVEGVKYDRCLTVNSAQGQEYNVVIYMFKKPRTNAFNEVEFVSSYQRLSAALTLAKKLLIAVVKMPIWNSKFFAVAKSGSSRFLASVLRDVVDKVDVLEWVGRETVERAVGQTQRPVSHRLPLRSIGSQSSRQFSLFCLPGKNEKNRAGGSGPGPKASDEEVDNAIFKLQKVRLNQDKVGDNRRALNAEQKAWMLNKTTWILDEMH